MTCKCDTCQCDEGNGKGKMYIAGPMSGYDGFNFDKFNIAEDVIRDEADFTPVNPAGEDDLNENGEPTKSRAEFMRKDYKQMLDCDAICLLPNWKQSAGAQSEVRMALEMDFDFYKMVNFTTSNIEMPHVEKIDNPETVLREAEKGITGSKMDEYGKPGDALKKIGEMWNGLFSDKLKGEFDATDVSLAMVCLKCVREETKHKRDNLVDIAGYAGLIELMKGDN